jgi:hypothetical protein
MIAFLVFLFTLGCAASLAVWIEDRLIAWHKNQRWFRRVMDFEKEVK